MTEAILIEIAQRRRKLEEAIERADCFLSSSERYHDREARNCSQGDSLHAKQQFEKHSNASVDISDTRAALEHTAEACRDDMNAMQDYIRKAMAVGA